APCPRSPARREGTDPPSHGRCGPGRLPREFGANREIRRAGPPWSYAGQLGACLGPRATAAPRDGATGHLPRAVVAQVSGLRATPCIRIGDAQNRALRLLDLLAAVVANQNGFPSHVNRLRDRFPLILRSCAGCANSPQTQQAQRRELFAVQTRVARADDP